MLTPEIYTGGMLETNGYLLRLPGCTLLVDAPQGVAAWLKEQQIRVDALLLTHQHFDHVMDAALVKAAHGCPIYAWAAFDRDLTLEKYFGVMAGGLFSVPEYQVDVLLAGRSELPLGEQTGSLLHTPGHSADSLCLHLPEHACLFGGDVLFYNSIGRTDFPGGSMRQLVQSIQNQLWPLPENTRVYPGHGPSTTLEREKTANPHL